MPKNNLPESYLQLLKKSLLNQLYLETEARVHLFLNSLLGGAGGSALLQSTLQAFVAIQETNVYKGLEEARKTGAWIHYGSHQDGTGYGEVTAMRNFTFMAHTMIGQARLDNLHHCMDQVTKDNIPGDLIETGVWQGGATIFMRGFLHAHGINDRIVWVADSFSGLPPNTHQRDVEASMDFSPANFPYLSVSEEKVRNLFERYDLLDKQVRFLKGWFKDTLASAPIEKLAVLRLDGDMYESTMDALNALYHKVSPGGFVIVDDYHAVPSCKIAVDEFRQAHKIRAKLIPVDHDCVYWRIPRKAT
jgi:O-methyltransferase